MIPFTKLHGIGNDYIYINAIKHPVENPKKLAIAMSNRNFGVGSDGLILILPSDKADFTMRMFNADGSEAEMCGNGIRGFAKYVYDHGLTKKTTIAVETLAGVKQVRCTVKNGKVHTVTVDMGEPILLRDKIPMLGNPGTVIEEDLHVDGVKFSITAVSMGNPHVVIYVEDVKNFPVEKYGPMIENHELFPKRTNVEFVQIVTGKEVIQRTWERGSGETLACGTGACAAVVTGIQCGLLVSPVTVDMRGGRLLVDWEGEGQMCFLSGPA